jgi:hypothetical protein
MVIITPKNVFADTIDSEKVRLNLFKEMFFYYSPILSLSLPSCNVFFGTEVPVEFQLQFKPIVLLWFSGQSWRRSSMLARVLKQHLTSVSWVAQKGPFLHIRFLCFTCHSCCFFCYCYCYCSYFYHDLCFSAHA